QAAEVARRLLANEEAIRALNRALALLGQLPESRERDREELALQQALTRPLTAARGYSSAALEAASSRVGLLARRLGEAEAICASALVLGSVHFVRGNIRRALDQAHEAGRLAEGQPVWVRHADWALGGYSISSGEPRAGVTALGRSLAGYDPRDPVVTVNGTDLGVFGYSWAAHGWWLLGRPGRALAFHDRAVNLARALQDPFSLTLADAYGAILHQMRGDRERALACSAEAIELSDRFGFVYYRDWAAIVSGWSDGGPAGIARIRAGLDRLQALDVGTRRPYYLGLLAETCLREGQAGEARAILDAALATAAHNEDRWWTPELHRLLGDLLGSEEHLLAALDAARAQESRALELRAALSLARSWQRQGRAREARDLLAPACASFGDSLDTPDLQSARRLLPALAG
ncbi:MAG TPA: hypothetical protein VHN99_03715, partial [Deinococcales bacterium]|nr:hypothetical protein [Deinococcales bacterium]